MNIKRYIKGLFKILKGEKLVKINFENNPFYRLNENYEKQLKQLREKVKRGEKIRVCFSVMYDSSFAARLLFEKMLESDIFEPYILVIPDTARGNKNMFYQMDKTYKTLSYKYENVYNSYDFENMEFADWSDRMDMCYFTNPYDIMTDKLYSLKYLSDKVLTFHIPYSYTGNLKYNINVYKSKEYSLFWKVFINNKRSYKLIQKNKLKKNDNLCVVGYPKMDCVSEIKVAPPERPLIIIAPHHTVRRIPGYLNISNFMRLHDFYLELPKKYPNIDFIFRPHPLLFITLSQFNIWSREKVNEYIERVKAIPNMEYQEGGEYFETFAKSSALINDCGSFISEYYYFNKPQCFVLENKKEIDNEFTEFGKQTLKHLYNAYTEDDIENFIDEVVIKQNDYMKEIRENYANKEIMINHPHASDEILKYLKGVLHDSSR